MVSQAPSRDPLRPSRRLRGRSVLSGHPSRTVRGRGRLPGPPPRGAPAGRDHRGDSERAPAAARRGGHHVRRWLCRQLPPRLSDPPALWSTGNDLPRLRERRDGTRSVARASRIPASARSTNEAQDRSAGAEGAFPVRPGGEARGARDPPHAAQSMRNRDPASGRRGARGGPVGRTGSGNDAHLGAMPAHGRTRHQLWRPYAHPSDPPANRGRGDEAGDRRFESIDRGAGGLSSALFCVSERRLLPLGRRSGGGCGPRGRIRRGQPGRSGSRGTLRDWSEPLGTRSGQRLRCRGERTSRRTSLAWITLSQIPPLMWQTRAYRVEDLGSLAEFLAPLGGESFSSRTRGKVDTYYRWKYGNGPGESNRVRVAVDTEGLIGVVALLPRCIKLEGRILTAFEMGDLLTAAGYRRQGVVRDRAYLEWRYEQNPTAYTILAARDADGCLRGYGVGLVVQWGGKRIGYLVDILTGREDRATQVALVKGILRSCADDGAQTVHTWVVKAAASVQSTLRSSLRSVGFFPRDGGWVLWRPSVDDLPSDQRAWYLTMADFDGIC